ncbi:DUF6969 family protein [Pseudomonas taeanensis]|uniref:DUF6969 family protein n=1 Tax=Pseudomonas taeanensis TaxID=574962 RepID=UPI0004694581|nr:hypothetical protein [Pseudomonas taeanensis]
MEARQPLLTSAIAELPLKSPEATSVAQTARAEMLDAAAVIANSYRALSKAGLNIVGEVLKGQEGFFEMNHYPEGDVFDQETHSQYYYHAHRESGVEHGHFHTFLRAPSIPAHLQPVSDPLATEQWPSGDRAIAHLIAVSMDAWGYPIGLFACNRWVTGETWYPASAVIQMLDSFSIDHAYPSWPVNLWLSAMLKLFRPQIEALLNHRDQVISAWQQSHPGEDVLEDRKLEITGFLPISVDDWVRALKM